jgi:hypothetical protein
MCFYPKEPPLYPEEVDLLWEPLHLFGDTPFGRDPFPLDPEQVPLGLEHIQALTLAAPGLLLVVMLAMLIGARLAGGRLTRAGWEVPGTIALALSTWTLWTLLPDDPIRVSDFLLDIAGRGWLGGPYNSLALAMESFTMSLASMGLVLGLVSLSPFAKRSGHSLALASHGALLIALAGIVECHRAILAAWELGQYLEAQAAWSLRRRLLWAGLFTAVLPVLALRRSRLLPGAAPSRHLGPALRGVQLALLLLCIAVIDRSVSGQYGPDDALSREPCCAADACGTSAPFRRLSPGHDYLFFSRNLTGWTQDAPVLMTLSEHRERFEAYSARPGYSNCVEPRRQWWW